jgi:L-amino acid N-acyltransferase YncA
VSAEPGIRNATPDDAAALAAIYNYYIQHTVITFEEELISAQEMRQRIEKVLAAGHSWLVALQNERVIGYAYSCQFRERVAYRYAVEVSVYLAHDTLSKGWGTRLYEALFAQLRAKEFHTALGGIALPNAASVAIHEKFGMAKVAHFEAVGFKFGEWIDVGYWQVQLQR